MSIYLLCLQSSECFDLRCYQPSSVLFTDTHTHTTHYRIIVLLEGEKNEFCISQVRLGSLWSCLQFQASLLSPLWRYIKKEKKNLWGSKSSKIFLGIFSFPDDVFLFSDDVFYSPYSFLVVPKLYIAGYAILILSGPESLGSFDSDPFFAFFS